MEYIENPMVSADEPVEPVVQYTCYSCGTELYAGDDIILTDMGDYCSKECLASDELTFDIGAEETECVMCNDDISYDECYMAQDGSIYCCASCYMEDMGISDTTIEEKY